MVVSYEIHWYVHDEEINTAVVTETLYVTYVLLMYYIILYCKLHTQYNICCNEVVALSML